MGNSLTFNEGNNVSVKGKSVKRNSFEWEDLTNSITDELAIEGLHFATNSVLNEKHFRNEVLPELIRNI